ncbi:MAG: HNH endonuclease [Parvularculaceae bacterium]|nr:HNH endonuclease [Parvularculaceae bacterium]
MQLTGDNWTEIAQLRLRGAPETYTWHNHQDVGRMQLVRTTDTGLARAGIPVMLLMGRCRPLHGGMGNGHDPGCFRRRDACSGERGTHCTKAAGWRISPSAGLCRLCSREWRQAIPFGQSLHPQPRQQ